MCLESCPVFDGKNGCLRPTQMELRDVHYVYPSRPKAPALRGVSLSLEPGRLLALVSAGLVWLTSAVLSEGYFYNFSQSFLSLRSCSTPGFGGIGCQIDTAVRFLFLSMLKRLVASL